MPPRKIVTSTSDNYRVTSSRGLQWAGAPCGGFLQLLRDVDGTQSSVDIPWDASWEPGTIVEVELKVTLVKAAPKSRKLCHNTWPAHVCDDGEARNRKRKKKR